MDQTEGMKTKVPSTKKRSSIALFHGFDFADFWGRFEPPGDVNPFTKERMPSRPAADARYIDAPLTDEKVSHVERALEYTLPAAYVAMARSQNGGIPNRTIHRLTAPTTRAQDHIEVSGIFGIGSAQESTLCGSSGSPFWIEDWEYPPIGVYFADCPSAGHDMLCLDYRKCGPKGEPAVVHVDQEREYVITLVAPDFESFVRGLVGFNEFRAERRRV
jgi:hypothetical protein